MLSKVILVMLCSTAIVSGQGRGGGGGDQGGGDTMSARALTPFEEFAGKLKIDLKTQGPAVEQIFADGAKEAQPVGLEIMVLRQRLVNAEIAAKPDDVKAALDACTTAAAKMAAIEAKVFAKVFAILTPAQQARGVEGFEQAFAIMAGFFQQAAPRGGGRGGEGRGGGR
jgi:hypothetical protein